MESIEDVSNRKGRTIWISQTPVYYYFKNAHILSGGRELQPHGVRRVCSGIFRA
jgi:hypothetical protein